MSDDNTRDDGPGEQPQTRQPEGGQQGGGARPQTFQGLASLRQAMAAARPATPAGPAGVPDTMASVPEDVHPVRIQTVGRYAIQIEWSDGHGSGIYPFARLRELGGS